MSGEYEFFFTLGYDALGSFVYYGQEHYGYIQMKYSLMVSNPKEISPFANLLNVFDAATWLALAMAILLLFFLTRVANNDKLSQVIKAHK